MRAATAEGYARLDYKDYIACPSMKAHGRSINASAGLLLSAVPWLREFGASIQSYRDPPKTLEELQQAVTPNTTPGYDDHHIVNQAARKEHDEERGFPKSWIDSSQNIVRIPKWKHWDMNAWYEKPNSERPFSGLSPREYLRGKDWLERYQLGLDVLIRHKVLKP